jgi:hypothetical protein
VMPSAPSRLTTPFMFGDHEGEDTLNPPVSAPLRFLTPHMSLMPGVDWRNRLYPEFGLFPVMDCS